MLLLLFVVLPSLCIGMPFDNAAGLQMAQYSDSFARNKMVALAATAYTDSPQTCVTNAINGTVRRQITLVCDPIKKDKCSGFTAVSHSEKAIALVYRGSDGFMQIIMEADESVLQKKISFGGGQVSEYFYNGFVKLWTAGMKDDFNALRNSYPDYDIWVTGHSLGGAMAAIASTYLVTVTGLDANKIKLITFGEPRTGNKDFAKAHDAALPYSFRVVHHLDIVPHIPFENMGYYHHKYEVWYDNNMSGPNYKICQNDEDETCSDGKLDILIPDHDVYFNKDLGDWADAGCV